MTFSASAHPLDVDLADLADGLADEELVERLAEHLAICLLCRIKLRRLREAAGTVQASPETEDREASTAETRPFVAPLFFVPEETAVSDVREVPAPGQVWAAGGDEQVLVLVVRVVEERVFVAPVTFDAEAADEETVVVGADRSPLREPLAVYPALAMDVPGDALRSRLGVLAAANDLDSLLDGSLPGTSRGTPIVGPTDPRLELRQLLADRLGSLEPIAPDPDMNADAPRPGLDQVASELASALRQWRGSACKVRRLRAWDDVALAHARHWVPIATVDEVGVLLVVFDTPIGLRGDLDFDAARSVVTRFNASAVVVLTTALNDLAAVFDPSTLSYGIDVPSGERTPPRPWLSELTPFDAISKFLEEYSGLAASSWPRRSSVPRVNVARLLSEQASAAIADAVRQGERAKIPQKSRGYTSVAGLSVSFTTLLGGALSRRPVADAIAGLAPEVDE